MDRLPPHLEQAGIGSHGLTLGLGDLGLAMDQGGEQPLKGTTIEVANGSISLAAAAKRTVLDTHLHWPTNAVAEVSAAREGPGMLADGLEQHPTGRRRR